MNYYTSTIPLPLAEKLKEKGMLRECILQDGSPVIYDLPQDDPLWAECKAYFIPSYAEVFDWLMEKEWFAAIGREYDFANELVTERFEWGLEKVGCFSSHPEDGSGFCDSWHEAANSAIEKALTLI